MASLLRRGSAVDCFNAGRVRFGRLMWNHVVGGPCPGGAPVDGRPFNVTVAVRAQVSYIYLDGRLVAMVDAYHETRGRVGVFAFNGRGNKVYFRQPRMTTASLPFG